MSRAGLAPVRLALPCRLAAAASLLFLLASPAAHGTPEEQNVARGFQPEKSYEIGDIDHVNLFNGNLVLTLPLGFGMQAGPDFGLALTLVHNGRPWDYSEANGSPSVLPSRSSNAGLGFRVSLGRVLHKDSAENDTGFWVYEEPDGARHKMFSKLRPNDLSHPSDPDVYYSRDASYLRMIVGHRQAEVHYPDGRRYVFRQYGSSVTTATPYLPQRFEDAHQNGFDINPTANPWTISGPHNRTARVYFDASAAKAGWFATRGGVVTRVTLPAPPEAGGTAEYRFLYEPDLPVPPGSPPKTLPVFHSACGGGGSTIFTLPLLRALELPDGTRYEFPEYITPTAGCSVDSGLLTRAVLPTQGVLEWTYGPWKFPVPGGTACKDLLHRPNGVTSRVMKNENGTTVGTRSYQHGYVGLPGCTRDGTPPNYVTTEVTNSLGHRTKHFFSVNLDYPEDVTAPWSHRKYGLPVSYHEPVTSGSSDPAGVSTKVYRGASDSTLIRSTYVAYDLDDDLLDQEFNPRRTYEKVVHHDDPDGSGNGRWQYTISSDFDGMGNFGLVERGTNFPGSAASLTTDTDYLLGTIPGRYDPWVLGLYDRRAISDGTAPEVEEFCFDTASGNLLRHRKLLSTSPGATDLLRLNTFGTSGYLTREDFYGGDGENLATGDLCSIGLSSPDYSLRHAYSYGVRSSTESLRANGTAMPFKLLDRTIQAATGLVDSKRSPSGINISIDYDVMGRPLLVKPGAGHDAWTEYDYTPPGPTTLAKVTVKQYPNGLASGADLTRAITVFDAFGRVYRENVYMPDPAGGSLRSQRQTLYNGEGWKTDVSEWVLAGGWRPATVFSNYDPFGRPGRITPPEGASRAVTLAYEGVRTVTRTVPTGTSRTAGGSLILEPVETEEIYDGFGRLYRVREQSRPEDPSNPALNRWITTMYTHDVAGRLTKVETPNPAGVIQAREFNYDRRGLLRSELQPEKDGYVLYRDHDARGNPWRIDDGAFDLVYTHDRAGRVTQIRERTGAQRLWKEFTYDSASHGGAYDAGQLVTAVRHNYVPVPWIPGVTVDVTVTEETTYNGRGGRPSARTTKLNTSGYEFSQTFTWNDIGDLESQSYPVCTNYECIASGAAVARTVQNQFKFGMLTEVTGYADLTYHPNQALATVAHSNGVTDTIDHDPYFRQRPYAIRTTAVPVVLGPYEFDGAGNITAIAGNKMLYDRVNRLVSYQFESGEKQLYGFDVWGNLTGITTVAGGSTLARTMPVDGTTNRLSGAGYDAAGNLTFWNGTTHTYDPFGLHIASKNPATGLDKIYFYTPSDERLYTLDYDASQGISGNEETWTLRGLDGKVLREYDMLGGNGVGNWSLKRDYVYRGGQLLAHVPGTGQTVHYTLDHLGSPRLLTGAGGVPLSDHHYYGFGEELVQRSGLTMKFTGHERDGNEAGTADDLDYMHARYYSPHLGRFLSVDPARGKPRSPQTLNRYAYVANRPVSFVDTDGRELEAFFLATGSVIDMTRHTAIYFRDDDPDRLMDLVFSHGGNANGIQTLSTYLGSYTPSINPTKAFRLDISSEEAESLLNSFMGDWVRRAPSGLVTQEEYHTTENNCAQYVCRKIISTLEWDPAQGMMIEILTVVESVSPHWNPPILTTNDALFVLRGLGVLGRPERGLQAPNGARKNVITYWKYNPPKE